MMSNTDRYIVALFDHIGLNELSRRTGLHRNTIRNLRDRKSVPSIVAAAAVAKEIGLPLERMAQFYAEPRVKTKP